MPTASGYGSRGRWHCAGASFVCAARERDWADIEGRIQYAYYTNDARALNSVLTSLKPKGGRGRSEPA